MDVRAIILIGFPRDPNDAPSLPSESPESFGGVPFALLPVLGQPILHCIVDRLKSAGAESLSVLNAAEKTLPLVEDAHRADFKWQDVSANQASRAAEEEFDSM